MRDRAHRILAGVGVLSPFVAAVLLACGGATPSDLFSPPTPGEDAGPPADTGTTTVDSYRPPGDTGVLPPIDSTVLDTAIPDTSIPIDTSPPGMGLSCGLGMTCSGSQYCCATSDPTMQNPTTYECMSGSTGACTSNGGSPIECTSQDDCTGTANICCGELNSQDQYTHVRCASSCDTAEDRTFCDPLAIPDVCEQSGTMCGPSTILPGFNVCQ